MTVQVVKKLVATAITNGKQFTTENIKIENATSVSIVTESSVDKYAIVSGGVTYKYAVSDYVINIMA